MRRSFVPVHFCSWGGRAVSGRSFGPTCLLVLACPLLLACLLAFTVQQLLFAHCRDDKTASCCPIAGPFCPCPPSSFKEPPLSLLPHVARWRVLPEGVLCVDDSPHSNLWVYSACTALFPFCCFHSQHYNTPPPPPARSSQRRHR